MIFMENSHSKMRWECDSISVEHIKHLRMLPIPLAWKLSEVLRPSLRAIQENIVYFQACRLNQIS